jgi:hypothetical protein
MALGLAAGYFLGRTRRMRLAFMIGAAAATGGAGGAGKQLLRGGTKLVASSELMSKISPAVTEITDLIRDELVDAAKGAAIAAVTSRIDSLSDNLHSRAEALRLPGGPADVMGDSRPGRTPVAAEEEELGQEAEEEELGEEEEEEEEEQPEDEPESRERVAETSPARRRGRPGRPAANGPLRRPRRTRLG